MVEPVGVVSDRGEFQSGTQKEKGGADFLRKENAQERSFTRVFWRCYCNRSLVERCEGPVAGAMFVKRNTERNCELEWHGYIAANEQ